MIRIKFTSIIFIIFFQPAKAFSGDINPEAAYGIKKFPFITTEMGATVNAIFQDEQGFMWFGSNHTMARFDGVHLQKFLEVDDSLMRSVGQISEIFPGRKDSIWIMMYGGIIDFALKTGIYQVYNLDDAIRKKIHFIDNKNYYNAIYPEGDILWIGTKQGLIEFDIRQQTLAAIYQINEDHPVQGNDIRYILPCDEGRLWIATANGVHRFDKKTKSFSGDLLGPAISKKYMDLRMERDPSGNLWIGFGGDLYRYNPSADSLWIEVKDFAESATGLQFDDQGMFSNDSILWDPRTMIARIKVLDGQQLLIAVKGHLVEYNHLKGASKVIWKNDRDDRPGAMLDLFIDPARSIWFANEFDGVICAYRNDPPVRFLRHMLEGSDDVFSSAYNIDIFNNDEVWIERDNGRGLARIDIATRKVYEYPADGLDYAITRRCVRDREGILWAIADGGIIYSFDPQKEQYRYFHCPDSLSRRSHWYFTMALDGLGHVWAGGAGSGLVRMDMETGNYEVFHGNSGNSNGFNLMPVWQILKIAKGSLLILGVSEVIRLDITERLQNDGNKEFKYHFSRYMDKNYTEIFDRLSTGVVCGYLDSQGKLWIGTNGNGAVCYSKQEKAYRYFNIENGLASDVVKGIIEDNEGFIWITTDKGLSRLDPGSGDLQNFFDWDDSVYPAYLFDWWDIHKDPQGYLYFGVLSNPMFLDPADFSNTEKDQKKLVLSDLKINNISQIPGCNGRFPDLINHLTNINLNHKDHILSIDYSVLDYLHNGSYNYRYMMQGLDKDWIDAGRNTFLSYSNLPAGDYSLIVNYSDIPYFDENNAIVLDIHKSPPPWNTWWAWLGYVLIGCAITFTIILLLVKRKRMRKQLDEEHRELMKIREIEEAKTRFFNQISHEIRTPLSLILQPIEELNRGETEVKRTKYYDIIQRNARRLKNLMEQILDFSRIEAGKMTLEAEQHDIMAFLRLAVANFSSLAESKKIDLIFNSKWIGSLTVCFDQDKMEKVIDNLISNALKFTSPGGKVTVTIEKYDHHDPRFRPIPVWTDYSGMPDKDVVIIKVEDTGIGIPPHLHERIFNRFERGELETDHAYDGMGLGLAISRELVELHKGRIWVQNNPGAGATFFVALPLVNDHVKDKKKTIDETFRSAMLSTEEEPVPDKQEIMSSGINDEKASILFIEDNDDMRRFFRLNMQTDFLVREAENGEKGLSLAREHIPDMIVSDIMMPGMDGVEVVRSLKSDRRTCHIPVILLTAKAAKVDKINALKTGADDYIIKPFDIHELKYRIRNQLNQLARLREQNIRTFLVKDPRASFNSRDNEFISELKAIVNRHLEDQAFSVMELSREMGVSRTQLFRKLKAITGRQPSEFIRCIRVMKAAELLKAGTATITEIAYDTGFNSISYFSRCFKEIYQVTPTEYMRNPYRNKGIGLSV